eukprot:2146328-Rhodomonas_salina.3
MAAAHEHSAIALQCIMTGFDRPRVTFLVVWVGQDTAAGEMRLFGFLKVDLKFFEYNKQPLNKLCRRAAIIMAAPRQVSTPLRHGSVTCPSHRRRHRRHYHPRHHHHGINNNKIDVDVTTTITFQC